jgi:glycosyltransferase involved in cell wall biosynthesis
VKPVALVTGEVSPYRREPFRMLDEAEGVEVLAWRETGQLAAARAVASGRHRAVIAGLGGRVALPATYAAARRAGIPFVLWASIWEHPRTLAHAVSKPLTHALYRRADAVVTYGEHVSAQVRRHRRAERIFEAPQAVSAEHFGRPVSEAERDEWRAGAGFLALFVGRLEEEKGVRILLTAWRDARLEDATLALAGEGPLHADATGRARVLGHVDRDRLPGLYAAADVLVLPSIRTATFTEPWGLVVNEAMHLGTPAITTDAVGAAAGGLVRDGRNGLVVPQRDPAALAHALRSLAHDRALRERLGAAAREDVARFSEAAWVAGMRQALTSVGAGR